MSARSILRRRREAVLAREVLARVARDRRFLASLRHAELVSGMTVATTFMVGTAVYMLSRPNPIFRDTSA
ncbi:MAG: hypothetical protein B7Z37_24030 [Verrucomicrobia bacterium 12-59-8]|nr:MAG: hypothetical protein B7Z37_24030 [Verrucomicrobia bacterium 12-59-8]